MSAMAALATCVYLIVALCCLAAARQAIRRRDRFVDRWHWFAGVAVFCTLIVFRLVNFEDRARGFVRLAARDLGQYGAREVWQWPLTMLVAAFGLALLGWFGVRWRRTQPGSRARLVLLAEAAIAAWMPLYGLRLISLHQTDWLLYSGPIRLNWLIEGAICSVVALSAAAYARRGHRISR